MDYRDRLIEEIASVECNRITRRVIRFLQQMTEPQLSGEDSGLRNVWDEVCVQVRGEESVYWDDYLSTIEDIITRYVQPLPVHVKQALWLQTTAGSDWQFEEKNEQATHCPYCEEEVVDYVLNAALGKADEWSNSRIEEYLQRQSSSD